ncbi:myb/SANT-like DNA-binding domain-containing protein 1 [Heterodontus francisci]|uniref:myb/SANT-like DNA-binding domain-containing protein 1 n=1 Tax=Heterodontus francisci TaxID=7792 RepID=UPI00355C2442
MARRASKNWADEEIKGLLSIWKDRSIQDQLAGAVRNKDVFVRISKSLNALGVNRDWKQCRAKVKNLKYEYRTMVNQRKSGRRCKSMRFYSEIDAVLGSRALQAKGAQDRTFLNVVVKQEGEEEKMENGPPQASSTSENVTACYVQPAAAISREEEDKVVTEPHSGADSVTAETEGPMEEEKISTASEAPAATSRKRTDDEHECSVPKKRMKLKKGTMFQRHIGTIINTFMDYQRKAEERFYKWEEERRREEREHELRIIQLLLDHSRSSITQAPQTPDYLRSLHSQNTHIFTPPPSNN